MTLYRVAAWVFTYLCMALFNFFYLLSRFITLAVGREGQSGNVAVTSSGNLTFNNSSIQSDTKGSDPAGNVTISSPGLVSFINSQIISSTSSTGQAGSIILKAPELQLDSSSRLFAQTISSGRAGNLTLQPYDGGQTLSVFFQEGAQISASTSNQGTGGNLTITAPNSVTIQGQGTITTSTTGTGDAGDITLDTSTLTIARGAQLFALTEGSGDSGTITVNAPTAVNLGIGVNDFSPVLSVETRDAGKAGSIIINTPTLTLSDTARITATATATATNTEGGGSISLNASNMHLAGVVGVFAETEGQTPAGTLTLQPYQNQSTLNITLAPNSQVSASTSGSGKGGDLILSAPQAITIAGQGRLAVESRSTGDAGNVLVTTPQFTLKDGVELSAAATDSGKAGEIRLNTQQLTLENDAQILASNVSSSSEGIILEGLDTLTVSNNSAMSASTQTGQAGSLRVNANSNPANSVQVSDNSRLSAQATEAGGNAGEVSLNTRQLTLENNSQISASNVSGVSEGIRVEGLDTLSVTNSLISASTETGAAGGLSVNATESVDLSGTGGLSVEATEGGTAGDLTVTTGQMSVREGAKVTVSSPSGQAGNLNISANSLSLNRGTLSAETGTSSNEGGANINLSGLDFLLMGNESLISANARGNASGGNITIDSTFIIATPPTGSQGSDIVANAVFGNGGQVSLTTQGLFGIEFRPLRTPKNDITVTSEFGLTGVFQRNSPDVDPSRGLTNLPAEFVDASNQITQNCPARGSRSENSFTITGTGGLPPRPGDAFDSPFPTGTVRSLPSSSTSSNESPGTVAIANPVELNSSTLNRSDSTNSHTSLVEAAGWMYGPNGEVILTAVTPNFTPHGSWSKPPTCD